MTDTAVERFEVSRQITATPAAIFALLREPAGHVLIDSSGMLQSADGESVRQVGDSFVVHMDREALGDLPMGRYDVQVIITRYVEDEQLEWTIVGTVKPPIKHLYGYRLDENETGTLVTSYYDWSQIDELYRQAVAFPSFRRPHSRRPWASWPETSSSHSFLDAPGQVSSTRFDINPEKNQSVQTLHPK